MSQRMNDTVVTATSPMIFPLDFSNVDFNIGGAFIVTGTVNYTVDHTYDNVLDPKLVASAVWFPEAAGLTGATTSQEGHWTIPISGLRVTVNSGSGSVRTVLLQQGII